jgi:hypothetical protein
MSISEENIASIIRTESEFKNIFDYLIFPAAASSILQNVAFHLQDYTVSQ